MRWACFILLMFVSSAVAQEPAWRAGFASTKITPAAPMWMSGYAARTAPAQGTELDLFAKAMLLQLGEQKLLVISLDLVGIDRALSLKIRERLERRFQLKREQIALACSHTHSGPVVGTTLSSMYLLLTEEHKKQVQAYTDALPEMLEKLVETASKKLQPVQLKWENGQATFAVNRRENKEADVPKLQQAGQVLRGPVDHAVPVLAARTAKGELLGILFGYACHATTLSGQFWNGDYPGYAMQKLEAAHPGTVALFFAGCGGDQNPIPRRSVELAQDYGQQLAQAVERVLSKPMKPVTADCHSSYREIDLPFRMVPTREQLIQDSTNANKYIASRAKLWLERLSRGEDLPKSYPYPVQYWKLGQDLKFVTLGGEVVVDYALAIKKEFGPSAWIMAYANDVMAYIPSARVLKEGGYEGSTAMIYYGLPSEWADSVERDILQAVQKLHQNGEAKARK